MFKNNELCDPEQFHNQLNYIIHYTLLYSITIGSVLLGFGDWINSKVFPGQCGGCQGDLFSLAGV